MNVMVVELIHGSIIFFVHSQSFTLYQMSIQLELDLIYLITFLSVLLYMWSPWLTRVPPFLLLLPLVPPPLLPNPTTFYGKRLLPPTLRNTSPLTTCAFSTLTDCSCHHELLDNYTPQLVTCLRHFASQCFPCHSPSNLVNPLLGGKTLRVRINLEMMLVFGIRCGCPSSGALCDIKNVQKGGTKLLFVG